MDKSKKISIVFTVVFVVVILLTFYFVITSSINIFEYIELIETRKDLVNELTLQTWKKTLFNQCILLIFSVINVSFYSYFFINYEKNNLKEIFTYTASELKQINTELKLKRIKRLQEKIEKLENDN